MYVTYSKGGKEEGEVLAIRGEVGQGGFWNQIDQTYEINGMIQTSIWSSSGVKIRRFSGALPINFIGSVGGNVGGCFVDYRLGRFGMVKAIYLFIHVTSFRRLSFLFYMERT